MFKNTVKKLHVFLGILAIFTITLGIPTSVKAANITDFKVPVNFTFKKDLKFGTYSSPDVMYLQNLLNMDASTTVATSGSGSNLTLTTYYGLTTRNAVDRFQKKFALDIAYEASLGTTTITEYGTTTATTTIATTTLTIAASSTFILSSSTVDVYTRAVMNKLIVIYGDMRTQYLQDLAAYASSSQALTPVEKDQTEVAVEGALEAIESADQAQVDAAVKRVQDAQKKIADKQKKEQQKNEYPQITDMPHEFIYKNKKLMFKYSPQGQLLKLIGGEKLVNQVFSFTPAGQVGQISGQGAGIGAGVGAGLGAGAGGGGGKDQNVLQNFGGQSTSMTTCTCSDNILLYINDVRGYQLPLIYQPGATILYSYYRPTSGVWMLGQYTSGGQCLVYSGTTCTSGGSPVGTMVQVGTSLTI